MIFVFLFLTLLTLYGRLPTPVFWPGEFHGLYSPWGHKEPDTTEQLSLHVFSSWQSLSPLTSLQMTQFHSFFYDWVIFCLRMYHIFFIYTSVGGRLGCFHVLAIINSTAMNIDIPVFFSGITSFSGSIASSGITGPYGSFIFSFPLRNLHTVLHNECIIQCECIMYIHTNSTEGFPFLNTFSSIYCL